MSVGQLIRRGEDEQDVFWAHGNIGSRRFFLVSFTMMERGWTEKWRAIHSNMLPGNALPVHTGLLLMQAPAWNSLYHAVLRIDSRTVYGDTNCKGYGLGRWELTLPCFTWSGIHSVRNSQRCGQTWKHTWSTRLRPITHHVPSLTDRFSFPT